MAERPGILRIGDRVVFSGAEYCVVFSTVRVAEASSCGAMSAINALRARCSAPRHLAWLVRGGRDGWAGEAARGQGLAVSHLSETGWFLI